MHYILNELSNLYDKTVLYFNPLHGIDRLASRGKQYKILSLRGRRWCFVFEPELVQAILQAPPDCFSRPPLLKQAREVMGMGLVTMEGGRSHDFVRKSLSRFFSQSNINVALPKIGQILSSELDQNTATNGIVDLSHVIEKTTLRSLSVLLFDSDIESDIAETMLIQIKAAIETMSPFHRKSRSPRIVENCRDFLHQVCVEMLNNNSEKEYSICPHLVKLENSAIDRQNSGTSVDHLITFFIAGHDTTSRLIEWTIYLVFRFGFREQFTTASRKWIESQTTEQESECVEFEKIISESLRLRPPVWLMGRQAKENASKTIEELRGREMALPYLFGQSFGINESFAIPIALTLVAGSVGKESTRMLDLRLSVSERDTALETSWRGKKRRSFLLYFLQSMTLSC